MTEKKENQVRYLSKGAIKTIHSILREKSRRDGEPIPSFSSVNQKDINSLVNTPKLSFFGKEVYPNLISKAAILFYSINKNHFFVNGNKRMSVYCLLVFLRINGKDLDVSQDELTEKAIWVAKTDAKDFDDIKKEIKNWIDRNLIKFNVSNLKE